MSLESWTDEELMEEYRLGDTGAFEELYRRHASRVYGFLRAKLSGVEADDLFQEVFTKLHTHRSKYDPALPFLPWLFTIANHAAVDHLRKAVNTRGAEREAAREAPFCASPAAVPALAALNDRMDAALSPVEKEVIGLRFDGDLSFREIARRLNLDTSNARKIASRALARLKALCGTDRGRDV